MVRCRQHKVRKKEIAYLPGPKSSRTAKAHRTEWATSKYGYIFSLVTWLDISRNDSGSILLIVSTTESWNGEFQICCWKWGFRAVASVWERRKLYQKFNISFVLENSSNDEKSSFIDSFLCKFDEKFLGPRVLEKLLRKKITLKKIVW